jgi:hypothetical protein
VLTLVLYGLVAVVVAVALFLLAAYLLPAGEQIAPPIRDEPLWELPRDKQLESEDVVAVRLPVALRGYRFAETDLLLDRLADELKSRDEQIARLRGGAPEPDESTEVLDVSETDPSTDTSIDTSAASDTEPDTEHTPDADDG